MTWDTTTPAGSEAASSGDDRIRELKTDIQTALQVEGAFPVNTASPEFHPRGGKGANASRPAAAAGGLWFDTTNGLLTRSTGSAWEVVASMGTVYSLTSELATQTISAGATTDLTGLSVTLTTIGRPVLVSLVNGSASNAGYVQLVASGSQSVVGADVIYLMDGTAFSLNLAEMVFPTASSNNAYYLPLGAFQTIFVPAAGSHTIKAQVFSAATNATNVVRAKLMVLEL